MSTKVGLQIQTVFPSLSLFRYLRDVQMGLETHLQVFGHLETGWSMSGGAVCKVGGYLAVIEHFGLDLTLQRQNQGVLSISLDNLCLVLESVQRAEVSISANQSTNDAQINEQLTFGGNTLCSNAFLPWMPVACALPPGISGCRVVPQSQRVSSLSRHLVVSIHHLCWHLRCWDVPSRKNTCCDEFLAARKWVSIAEDFTIGADFGGNSAHSVAGSFKASVRSMNRLNASLVVAENKALSSNIVANVLPTEINEGRSN
ncbi:MAG: hypothetical protein H7240_10865 [Glaciimonas sp.]|nr:hypothetical protein [Glaciimonas sp.]